MPQILVVKMNGKVTLKDVKYKDLHSLEKEFFKGEPCDINPLSERNSWLTIISLMDYIPDENDDEAANLAALQLLHAIGAYDKQAYLTIPSGPIAVTGPYKMIEDDAKKIFFDTIPKRYLKALSKLAK